jgi:hypothetical protein
MKNNNEWLVRKRRYERNNNIVGRIFMRLYYRLWWIASVILFGCILIMFFSRF